MRFGFRIPAPIGLAIALLAATFACGAQPGPASNPSPSAAQGTAPTAKISGPCANRYFPVVKGATWSYTRSSSASAASAKVTSVITEVGANGFTVLTTVGTRSANVPWTCLENGLLNGGTGILGAVLTGTTGSATVNLHSNSGVTTPVNINTGDTWNQTTTMDAVVHGAAFTAEVTTDFKALATDSVTVPAGTYSAFRISVTTSIHYTKDGYPVSGSYNGTVWLAPDIGSLKATGSTSIAGVTFDSTDVLDSYSIPKP